MKIARQIWQDENVFSYSPDRNFYELCFFKSSPNFIFLNSIRSQQKWQRIEISHHSRLQCFCSSKFFFKIRCLTTSRSSSVPIGQFFQKKNSFYKVQNVFAKPKWTINKHTPNGLYLLKLTTAPLLLYNNKEGKWSHKPPKNCSNVKKNNLNGAMATPQKYEGRPRTSDCPEELGPPLWRFALVTSSLYA